MGLEYWRGALQVGDYAILASSCHSLRLALAQSFRNIIFAHEVFPVAPLTDSNKLAGSLCTLDPPC